MTESDKQKLRLLSFFLVMASMIFWLEAQGVPGWKYGMSLLLLAILNIVDIYLEKRAKFRIPYIIFCLFFLLFAIKNFMAH